MDSKSKVSYIEYRLNKIFKQNKISKSDVNYAKKLFDNLEKLTEYKEDDKNPIIETILDEEPNSKLKK